MTKGKKCPHLEFCTAHDGYCLSLSNVFQGRRCSFPLVAASCHQMPPRGSAPVASMRVSQSSSNVCKCGCDPGRSSGDGKLAVCLQVGQEYDPFVVKILLCSSIQKSGKELPKQFSSNIQALPSPSLENADNQGSAIGIVSGKKKNTPSKKSK